MTVAKLGLTSELVKVFYRSCLHCFQFLVTAVSCADFTPLLVLNVPELELLRDALPHERFSVRQLVLCLYFAAVKRHVTLHFCLRTTLLEGRRIVETGGRRRFAFPQCVELWAECDRVISFQKPQS